MSRQEFLQAVETSNCQVFVEWYLKAQNQDHLAIKECIQSLSQKELNGVWTVFKKWVLDLTKALSEETCPPSEKDKDRIMCSLVVMTSMALVTIQTMSNQPSGLNSSVEALNKSLKFVTSKKTGTSICEVCEAYWNIHSGFEIPLSINVIHWVLYQALHAKAAASSMKHLWNLKGSIEKLDIDTLESSGLLELFISGLDNPKFLSSSEGKKCIALLFNSSPILVQKLHTSLKKRIPVSSVSDCESIGEIYFKAWRTITEECRAEVEFSIQDLMYSAVVAHRRPLGLIEGGVNKIPMNKLVFHVLHAIHRQRKQRTVAILLYNLYKPILWRYLEASNSFVRANALCLFFDAFPFESGEGVEEDEVVQKKQWAVMLAALSDQVPLIRTIAIQGTCRILAEYWELVPVNVIQELITVMLRKLIYDSSSADVRAHVVKGLAVMLDSQQTHSLLAKMIPLTNKVLHDPHEKVRAEYVSMLVKTQKLRVGKLWEVIDVNHLIVRLAIDTSKTVCRRLVILLTPFFYPKGSSSEVIFQRCLRLVMDNRIASRKFYQHAHSCVGIEQLAQLILIIWKFLRNYVHKQLEKNKIDQKREESASKRQRSRPSKRSRRSEETGETSSTMTEEDKENQDLSSDNEGDEVDSQSEGCSEVSIIGLIDVVCILLSENKSKLKSPPHTVLWENIKSRFNKTCSLFFRYFKNTQGLRSLIYLYGLMSSTSSPHMLSFVKSQLKSLNDSATIKEFSHLIDVMCNWGRVEDLLESISDHLQDSLTALTSEQSNEACRRSTRGAGRKRVSFDRLSHDKPLLGLRYITYILQHPYNKKIVLRKNLTQMEQLCLSLKPVILAVEASPAKLSDRNCFLFAASCLYVKILLVLTCSYKREESTLAKYNESQEKIVEILKWTSRLMKGKDINPLVGDLVSSVVSSINNLIMLHFATWTVCHQFLDVVLEMCMRFPSSGNLTLAMNCAYHSMAFVWSERSIGNECNLECDVGVSLVIKYVLEYPSSSNGKDLRITEDDWPQMRDIIRKILEECHRNNPETNENLRAIMRSMIDTIRLGMMLNQPEIEDASEVNTSYLLQLSKAIIASFRNRTSLTEMILSEFYEIINNEREMILLNVNALTRLVEELSAEKGRTVTTAIKTTVISLERLWSTVEDAEKASNEEIALYIGSTLQALKKSF